MTITPDAAGSTLNSPEPKWTKRELSAIDDSSEVNLATRRNDGTLRRARIVWIVRHHDAVYVRSVNGVDADWYRGALTRHEGRLTAGAVERDVQFIETNSAGDNQLDSALDAAYQDKYRQWVGPVARITGEQARVTTLRLDPA